MGITPPPVPVYDPVTRIVTIKPLTPLVPGQIYEVEIKTPTSPTDPDGLRAIDGATLDANDPSKGLIAFTAGPPSTTPTPPIQPLNFCVSVQPILVGTCSGNSCHGGYLPAAGLELTSGALLSSTAIGRVAHGSNTGPSAAPEAPGLTFGLDMPIVDPGIGGAGDPADSYLIYKVLLAHVPAGSPPAAPSPVQWQPLSDSERAILGNYVNGREMPYPGTPSPAVSDGLSTQQIETLSVWIAQGAGVSDACDSTSTGSADGG